MQAGLRLALSIMVAAAAATRAWSDDAADLKPELPALGEQQQADLERLMKKVSKLEEKNLALGQALQELRSNAAPPVAAEVPVRGLGIPQLQLRGFASATYLAGQALTNTYRLGEIDLFVTSKLSDEFSVLSEIGLMFEEDNESHLDVERLQLTYSPAQELNLLIGRYHTPLGYWNATFHHGVWFQTTAFRPEMYRFEDNGGILPMHSVGAELFGARELSGFDLEYALGVANGRGPSMSDVQNFQDANRSKSLNLLLSLSPQAIKGLKVGADAYLDTIPPDPGDPARNGSMDERILSGYAVFQRERLEVLVEAAEIRHDDDVSDRQFDTLASYAQAGYQLNRWKPYYRFDYIDFGSGDPFYAPVAMDLAKHTVGLRWDPITWAALKLEYSYRDQDDSDGHHAAAVQAAFTF